MSNYELASISKQRPQLATSQMLLARQPPQTQPIRVVQAEPPNDRLRIVFFVLLIHGVGSLMPWNAFINAEGYFRNYKLAGAQTQLNMSATSSPSPYATQQSDMSNEELDLLRKNFLPYLSMAAQIPNVLFQAFNLFANVGSGNLKLRVNITLIIEAIIFLLTIALAVLDSSKWPRLFFLITISSVIVLNMASGIYQNCIFGTGAIFPGTYTNAILIGSNFSGTFTSIVNLLSIYLAPAPETAAMYYFIATLCIIVICLISYNLLPLNAFYCHFEAQSKVREQNELEIESTPDQESRMGLMGTRNDEVPDSLRRAVDAMQPKSTQVPAQCTSSSSELHNKWLVFLKCWPQCLNVYLTFFVTLALFPAIMANIKQSQNYFSDTYFTPVACFFVFNLFAMIGNLISGLTTWPGRNHVWILIVVRILFLPYFMFCNFNPSARHWPVLIKSDIAYILGNVLLAISSGYLSSLCMMFASSELSPSEAPKAGMLAAFFLVFGIFSGVYLSLLLTGLVELG